MQLYGISMVPVAARPACIFKFPRLYALTSSSFLLQQELTPRCPKHYCMQHSRSPPGGWSVIVSSSSALQFSSRPP